MAEGVTRGAWKAAEEIVKLNWRQFRRADDYEWMGEVCNIIEEHTQLPERISQQDRLLVVLVKARRALATFDTAEGGEHWTALAEAVHACEENEGLMRFLSVVERQNASE